MPKQCCPSDRSPTVQTHLVSVCSRSSRAACFTHLAPSAALTDRPRLALFAPDKTIGGQPLAPPHSTSPIDIERVGTVREMVAEHMNYVALLHLVMPCSSLIVLEASTGDGVRGGRVGGAAVDTHQERLLRQVLLGGTLPGSGRGVTASTHERLVRPILGRHAHQPRRRGGGDRPQVARALAASAGQCAL